VAKRGTRRIRLETALNAVETPVFVIDAQRRVVFVNQGCELLTGWTAAETVGRVCDFASSAEPTAVESLTESLCPPPEVFDGAATQTPRYFINRNSLQTSARLVHFFPLDESDRSTFILGVVTDVPSAGQPTGTSVIATVHAELAALRHDLRERYDISSIVCRSPGMQRVLEQAQLARQSNAIVHFTGQPGTGKEHVARAIHYAGPSGQRAFVPLNCRQLPAIELRESLSRLVETDWADVSTASVLQPGTVFLDYIERLPRDLQQRLRDFIPSRHGAAFRNQVRLMTASSVDLSQLRDDESLTEEFYFLVTTLQIELPPLAHRTGDLHLLTQHFLEQRNHGSGQQISGFTDEVNSLFEHYNWPGNLDELERVVSEAHAACGGSVIGTDHLPFRFRTGLDAQSLGPRPTGRVEPLEQLLTRIEREHIANALELASGNKAQAAKLLGLTRPALYRRLESLGLGEERS